MQSWICTAIGTIRVVSFSYESMWYVVEPFVYGTREDDVDVMVAYVLKSSGHAPIDHEWKIFETGKIGARAINYDPIKRDREGQPEVSFKSTYCQIKQKTH